jgi:large subunit ribosomal protein L5
MARLKEKYQKEVKPALIKKFSFKSPMQAPKLDKIVVNMGVGEGTQDQKLIEAAAKDLAAITGQKPSVRRSKKSIANFKLRAGVPIGCMVTMRGDRMYEFFDRLVNVAIPRIRDFRGLATKSFDGRGNYTLGFKEQIIFPEINYDKVVKQFGMDISIVTTAVNDEQAKELLALMGMPFQQQK